MVSSLSNDAFPVKIFMRVRSVFSRDMSQTMENVQYCSADESFKNHDAANFQNVMDIFLAQKHISDDIFIKIGSVVFLSLIHI